MLCMQNVSLLVLPPPGKGREKDWLWMEQQPVYYGWINCLAMYNPWICPLVWSMSGPASEDVQGKSGKGELTASGNKPPAIAFPKLNSLSRKLIWYIKKGTSRWGDWFGIVHHVHSWFHGPGKFLFCYWNKLGFESGQLCGYVTRGLCALSAVHCWCYLSKGTQHLKAGFAVAIQGTTASSKYKRLTPLKGASSLSIRRSKEVLGQALLPLQAKPHMLHDGFPCTKQISELHILTLFREDVEALIGGYSSANLTFKPQVWARVAHSIHWEVKGSQSSCRWVTFAWSPFCQWMDPGT